MIKQFLEIIHILGQYDKKKGEYKILLIEPTQEFLTNKKKQEKKLKYLKDFKTIALKREFKNRIKMVKYQLRLYSKVVNQ